MLKLLNRSKNKKGFTLIELIVVIAILAILAAILVPTMLGVVGDSKQKVADSNAQTLYSAAQAAYVAIAANGGTVPSNGTSYDQDDSNAFMTELEKNLGSLSTGEYTILFGSNGITSVTFKNGDKTGTYPASTSSATSST